MARQPRIVSPSALAADFSSGLSSEPTTIVRLWMLRLLVPLGLHRSVLTGFGFEIESQAEFLGMGDFLNDDNQVSSIPKARIKLRQLHLDSERKRAAAVLPECLQRNVARLSALVGLSANDGRILAFVVLLLNERMLSETADRLGRLPLNKLYQLLSVLLDMPVPDVRAALSVQGALARSGLVSLQRSGGNALSDTFNLLSDNFANHIASLDADPVSLIKETVALCTPPHLALSDYPHLQTGLDVLRPYLQHAVSTGRKGVNIFLHGPPGTGKSQLARVLAADLGCELFEVASEDAEGDPISGGRRLRAFRAAQCFFAQHQALILFDEVEDVFDDTENFLGSKSSAQRRKAWVNRTLEDNAVPALWLSNTIADLDPAFVRRFDMLLELPVPPKAQRERILQTECVDLLSPASISRLADAAALAPAVVARAAAVGRAIAPQVGAVQAAQAVELLVNSTLQAQGHPALPRPPSPHATLTTDVYDASLVSADADLLQLAAGLQRSRAGRLCLFGPPGTGKTAYGRWLAGQLGVPLHVKRASDLMSEWVGGNEKNIAQAFRQAEQDGALLLIDEVDSFLQDRRGAKRSWEVSLVNEMLTSMETFEGVFIASTNLMHGLDPAALRRFDLKVKFDYLQPAQAAALLGRYCHSLGLAPPANNAATLARLTRLQGLTPGDFAAVVRQSRFLPLTDADSLLAALAAECALKSLQSPPMGFM